MVVMSFGRRPNASAIACTFSPGGLSRSIDPRARGPTAIFRMYMSGRFSSESGSPTAIIDIAPLPPRATTPRPSSGSSARSTFSPPAPIRWPTWSGESSSTAPITIRPSIGNPSSAGTHRLRGVALGAFLVGASEPAGGRERRTLRHAHVLLAEAKRRGLGLGRRRRRFPGRSQPWLRPAEPVLRWQGRAGGARRSPRACRCAR